MKAIYSLLLFALVLIAAPAQAAISTTSHAPPRAEKSITVEAADKAMVENHEQELPLECRGYYVRAYKTSGINRCN